jgi:FkbH-like protein
MTLDDFIKGLDLHVDIRPIVAGDLARVLQLAARTNQFNNTGASPAGGEIEKLLARCGYECDVVSVSDRFGDYGLTGVMIYKCNEDALRVKRLLLSCRALGRGVEDRMFERLEDTARERAARAIEIEFRETPKNYPARAFLDALGGTRIHVGGETSYYRVSVNREAGSSAELGFAERATTTESALEGSIRR